LTTTAWNTEINAALLGYTPSTFQTDIFDWGLNGRGNGIVKAVAGSGKTTVLVSMAKLITGSAIFVCFNKHTKEALTVKLAGTSMIAKTINSVGAGMLYAHLGKTTLDDRKYTTLCREMVEREAMSWTVEGYDVDEKDDRKTLKQMVDMARETLTDTRDSGAMIAMCARFNIPFKRHLAAAVPVILRQGDALAKQGKVVDFKDQLYLPVVWNLRCRTYDWVMDDECQDNSAVKTAIIRKLMGPGARLLAVGDPNQSIMAFAGADADAYTDIKAEFACHEMPLSICYRCPTTGIALAQTLVPEIQARPNAPVGSVRRTTEERVGQELHEGDMVLCRMTAPLISLCLRLIQSKISARVKGRDIGAKLNDKLDAIAKLDGFQFSNLLEWLEAWRTMQVNAMSKGGSDDMVAAFTDECEAIKVCAIAFAECKDLYALQRSISSLFSEDRASITLCTVHKAKGLENERIFILRPDRLPMTWKNQTPAQAQQEKNLEYVAYTRHKEELVFVDEK
ncbi:MAG: UvrD-helicase domain-containing protein, partial [Chloroflexales bacterium]